MEEPQYLYLITTGRKTGDPHEIEIWFVAHDGCYYLVSGGGEKSDWVQNIQHNPAITFRVGEQTYQGSGRVIDADEEPELSAAVSQLMVVKYKWGSGVIVELKPEA